MGSSQQVGDFINAIQKKDYENIFGFLVKQPVYFKNFSAELDLIINIDNGSASKFRYQLIRYFAFSKLPPTFIEEIKYRIENALKVEFLIIGKNKFPTPDQVDKLCFYLDVIYKLRLRNLLHKIVAYSSFPLHKVRIKCLKALSFMNNDQILPFIMKMLTSEHEVERIYALEAFYYLRDERMISILLNSLRDKNKSVRYFAMSTLDKLDRTEAIPMFIQIIRSDNNDEVREKAIHVLKKFKPKNGLYAILEALHDDNIMIRKASLETALVYKSSKVAYHIALQLPEETNNELKLSQVKALLHIGYSGGMKGLSSVLHKEEDLNILRWSIYTAGELKDYFSFSQIIKLMNHKKLDIRIEASVAIGKYRDPRASASLIRIIKNPDEKYGVQIGALHSLKKINDPAVITQLKKILYTHKNIYLRAQIKELYFSQNKDD